MITAETDRSRRNARDILAAFDAAAEKSGILHDHPREMHHAGCPYILVEYARLRESDDSVGAGIV